jgi:TonB family protein
MTPLAHAFSTALLYFVAQGLFVAGGLWVALRLLVRRSAALRYVVCCAALVLLVALPVITTWMLWGGGHAQTTFSSAHVSPVMALAPVSRPSSHRPDVTAGIQLWALPVWAIGVLFFSVRIAWGYGYIARHRRSSEPASADVLDMVSGLSRRMGLDRFAQVLISNLTDGPSVVGWLRPVILLPMSAVTGLAPEQLEAVLAHELAHIRRHDYLVNLLQMAAEALLFYHPAVWWVSGRIRVEREFCCDDLAVSVCQNAVTYARALSTLEKLRPAIPAIAMGSTGGPLLARIQRILGRPAAECGPSRWSAVAAVSMCLVCLLGSFLRGQEAPADGAVRVAARGLSIIYQTPIEYPASAIAAGAQGRVFVTVTTDAAGRVTDAALIEPTRNPAPHELQQLVLDSVRKWRVTEGPANPADNGPKYIAVFFEITPPLSASQRYAKEGDTLFKSGKVDEALRWYEEGETKFPQDRITFLKRETEVYIRQEKTANAYEKDMEILKADPHDQEAVGLQASFILDRGDADTAIKMLRSVVASIPDNFVARFNLGRAYFAKDQVDEAAKQFESALRLRPHYLPALLALAQLDMRKHDYDAASTHVNAVLANDPANAGALTLRKALDERR